MNTRGVTYNRHSTRIAFFVDMSIEALSKYCSVKYAKQLIRDDLDGTLYGLCLTKGGKIRGVYL